MTGQLFLAGGGTEKQSFTIDECFAREVKNILYIPVAWKNEDWSACLNWFTNLMKLHKSKAKITMLTELNKKIDLKKYDAIYIGGGNTFKLLKKIKESKFDEKLIKYWKEGGKVYGGSAGAIIWGKSIDIALICEDADVNEVKLKDTLGFNVCKDYDLQCHFEDSQIEEHFEFIKKTNTPVIALPEETALLIENNTYKIIGDKPATIITSKGTKKYFPGEKISLITQEK